MFVLLGSREAREGYEIIIPLPGKPSDLPLGRRLRLFPFYQSTSNFGPWGEITTSQGVSPTSPCVPPSPRVSGTRALTFALGLLFLFSCKQGPQKGFLTKSNPPIKLLALIVRGLTKNAGERQIAVPNSWGNLNALFGPQ